MSLLDPAALHPALQPAEDSGRHYFAEAGRLRSALAAELARALGAADFVPYLLHNTTSGLVAVLWAAARAGHQVRAAGPAGQHYPPYAALLPLGGPGASWEFRTHVGPTTGVVDPLGGPGAVRIVDAAQSLGTLLTPVLLDRAEVIVAPLHKHLGLATGAGIVLVRRQPAALAAIHEVLRVAASGAQSIELLRSLAATLTDLDGKIFNRVRIRIDDDLRGWCAEAGLRLLGEGAGVPFACVTTVDGGPIAQVLSLRGWRHFAELNIARFSLCERGRAGDPPVDRTAAFRTAVVAARAGGLAPDGGG